MIDAANVAQKAIEKRLWNLQLSLPQQRILAAVYAAKEPLTPSMLATILLQETHSVSGLLNRLEDRDLITRTRDRRVVWVGLTTGGRNVVEESMRIVANAAKELGAAFRVQGLIDLHAAIKEVQRVGSIIVGVREDVREEALRRVGQ